MENSDYEIGKRRDHNNEPLVFVGGQLFGTVAQVKTLISEYEAAVAQADFDLRVIAAVQDAQKRRIL